MMWLFWRAARVQLRARTFGVPQCIILFTEMLFDYLIAILDQKLVKIVFHEIGSFSKISKEKKTFFFQQKFGF